MPILDFTPLLKLDFLNQFQSVEAKKLAEFLEYGWIYITISQCFQQSPIRTLRLSLSGKYLFRVHNLDSNYQKGDLFRSIILIDVNDLRYPILQYVSLSIFSAGCRYTVLMSWQRYFLSKRAISRKCYEISSSFTLHLVACCRISIKTQILLKKERAGRST